MADYIEVSLQLSDYPGLIVNDSVLHLKDKACVAGYKDENMVKFTFGLEACMTTQEDDGEKIYYMNSVYLQADEKADDEAITRKHMEVIPFKCGYDKKTVISKVSYSPRSTLVITDAGNLENLNRVFWNIQINCDNMRGLACCSYMYMNLLINWTSSELFFEAK